LDTAHRLGQYSSCHAYTFHGLAGNLFGTLVNTDDVLRELRASSAVPICPPPLPYEYLVLDELQDMTPDLYWLTMNIISALARSSGRAPRILILGDSFQAMHQFRGADARYLDLAPDIFSSVSPYPWAEMSLSKSFRLSQETASFLNHGFLGGKQIIEGMNRGGEKPQYVRFDPSDYVKGLAELCLPVFKRYGCENSAILAPSVRRNWLLSAFTNALSKEHRLPVAVSIGDDVELREQVIRGKIVVSTIHQFKGSQRDFVIVFGADAGYFKFFGRDLPDDRCPNTIYVALTRAREQVRLWVIIACAVPLLMPLC
jgi:superfamily I DNA/RNA helicase